MDTCVLWNDWIYELLAGGRMIENIRVLSSTTHGYYEVRSLMCIQYPNPSSGFQKRTIMNNV